MNTEGRLLGKAKRIRVKMPAAARCAWDCRPFGLGRVVAPMMATDIEIANGVMLNLRSGELRATTSASGLRSSAA